MLKYRSGAVSVGSQAGTLWLSRAGQGQGTAWLSWARSLTGQLCLLPWQSPAPGLCCRSLILGRALWSNPYSCCTFMSVGTLLQEQAPCACALHHGAHEGFPQLQWVIGDIGQK